MKKFNLAFILLSLPISLVFAQSQVTVYGKLEGDFLVSKVKGGSTKFQTTSGFSTGSRWGIAGKEELGDGYAVGFRLEQGFDLNNGSEANSWKKDGKTVSCAFSRDSRLYVDTPYGHIGYGRFSSLGHGTGAYHLVYGWAFGAGFTSGSWLSFGRYVGRVNNGIVYTSPIMNGLKLEVMYSNGVTGDEYKWSENAHYYGLGAKYTHGSLLIATYFEESDNKEKGVRKKPMYVYNLGLEYKVGRFIPMLAYQYNRQDQEQENHVIGLSSKIKMLGGEFRVGSRVLLGKSKKAETIKKYGEKDRRAWSVNVGYLYPISKRTEVVVYTGYADGSKLLGYTEKGTTNTSFNGWQTALGLRTVF